MVIKTWSVSQSEQRLISMCDYFYFLVGPPRLVTGNFINQSLSLSDYYFKFSSKNRKKDYYFKYCCWIALNFKDPIANPFNLVFAKAINVYVGQVTVFRKSKNKICWEGGTMFLHKNNTKEKVSFISLLVQWAESSKTQSCVTVDV